MVVKAKKKPTPKKVIKNRKLGEIVQSVVKSFGELNPWMAAVEKRLQIMGTNQMELSRSQHGTDDQMAVMIRASIMQMNKLTEAVRHLVSNQKDPNNNVKLADGRYVPWQSIVPDPLTFNGVNKMFEDWDAFKKRPDYKDLFREWYMGNNLADLPPIPASAPKASGDNPEGTGGNNAESTERNDVTQVPAGETPQPNAVPEVQSSDKDAH